MNTPQNQISIGFKITINWQNPTVVLKEKFFYDDNTQKNFVNYNVPQLSGIPQTKTGSGVTKFIN